MPSRIHKLFANFVAMFAPTKKLRHQIRGWILGHHKKAVVAMTEQEILRRAQDLTFPVELFKSKRIMVIVVPEHNDMSGGIYSMFSIANQMYNLRRVHGYDVMVMTRPNKANHTYIRLSAFRNSETVYRFEQLLDCKEAEEVYLQLPEYAAKTFMDDLTNEELEYLSKRRVYVNILNQNIELMPEPSQLMPLRMIVAELTQSVAHHAYFGKEFADKYELPTLLLPAYTDLSSYPSSSLEEKKKLIIHSLDEAPHKAACLDAVKEAFPDFELVEIKGMKFDRFMELATDCMFSISFGEGFDGYIAQPIHQGGIGLTAYNDEFFPSPHFKEYPNIFESKEEMVVQLVPRMRQFLADPELYKAVNRQFVAEYDKLYSFEDYLKRIRMLAMREFEVYPTPHVQTEISDPLSSKLKAIS